MTVQLRPKRLERRRNQIRPVRSEPRRTGPVTKAPAEVTRARRAGGPEDHALYTCGCGYAFEATVSTSVGCPSCGADQAW